MICDNCGARAWVPEGEERTCADCGGPFRRMALLEGIVDRWFAPREQRVSEFYPRHLKLVELMWTAHGRGRETYEALGLGRVSYTQFVTRATEVVVQGLADGWIEARVPPAPSDDDEVYEVRFLDPERWAEALLAAFDLPMGLSDQVRVDVEGDPDVV